MSLFLGGEVVVWSIRRVTRRCCSVYRRRCALYVFKCGNPKTGCSCHGASDAACQELISSGTVVLSQSCTMQFLHCFANKGPAVTPGMLWKLK